MHKAHWLLQQNRMAGANSGQEQVLSSSAAHSNGCKISIEELNPFSPLEDVPILPGRVCKGKCGTLWTPGVWVSAPEQGSNVPCQLQSAGRKWGPLTTSAGERCAISRSFLNSNPTMPLQSLHRGAKVSWASSSSSSGSCRPVGTGRDREAARQEHGSL